MKMLILPSLLAADFGNLETAARKAETSGGDALHLDIMDGHFVPNISFGPAVVEMARKSVSIPLSVHLMLTNPDRYVKVFAKAGASTILIHIEARCDVPATLKAIRGLGVTPGITVNPETPIELLDPVLPLVEEVLCMTVHPGYGGQAFMPEVLPKIRRLRSATDSAGRPDFTIMVDGGVDRETVGVCAEAGANAFVAGTSLFRANDMAADIRILRERSAASWGARRGN